MALVQRPLTNEAPQPKTLGDLDLLDQRELLRLRHEIDIRLNLGTVQDIDLGEELTVQLRTVKALQAAAHDSDDTPYNQQAQTAAVVQSLLKDLVKLRTAVHDAEFAKALEGMVIQAFTKCEAAADPQLQPVLKQVKDLFFEQYEKLAVPQSEA